MQKHSTLISINFFIADEEEPVKTSASKSQEPGKMVIQNILNYSKALKIKKTSKGEIIEMVNN